VEPGLTSACTPTITYDKKGTEPSATIVLNGNQAFDYSPLGNEIAVTTNSVPLSGSGCNGTYDGIFQGNITVSAGQNCVFTNGGATGTVTENGGKLTLTQSQVGGDVQIMGGTFALGAGTSIGGNLLIQNLPTGSGQNQICGTTVGGNLQFQNSGVGLEIGSLNPNNCAGNTVGGNLLVQSNTAATQVYNNTVTNDLICSGNTTITGGANKAKAKQGQCATF
jgi:lipopolysaccharide export system protein LptA